MIKKYSEQDFVSFESIEEETTVKKLFFPFENILDLIIKLFEMENKYFTLFFCSEKLIRSYNRQYRLIDKPTDVLSFPFSKNEIIQFDGEEGNPEAEMKSFAGDILICGEYLNDKALENDELPNELLLYMIIHSYLHLIGYEHENEDDYRKMENKTETLLRRIKDL